MWRNDSAVLLNKDQLRKFKTAVIDTGFHEIFPSFTQIYILNLSAPYQLISPDFEDPHNFLRMGPVTSVVDLEANHTESSCPNDTICSSEPIFDRSTLPYSLPESDIATFDLGKNESVAAIYMGADLLIKLTLLESAIFGNPLPADLPDRSIDPEKKRFILEHVYREHFSNTNLWDYFDTRPYWEPSLPSMAEEIEKNGKIQLSTLRFVFFVCVFF